jgi:hypothetical protein
LSWDQQNRLIESEVKDGVVKLSVVHTDTWEKQALTVDGNILRYLKSAGIDDKSAQSLAEKLGQQVQPGVKSYLFSYKNDLWLLDLKMHARAN